MKHSLTRHHGTRSKQYCATVPAVNRTQQNIPTLNVFLAVPHLRITPQKYEKLRRHCGWRKGGFHRTLKETRSTFRLIECFHMTSRRPYWCPTTMKRRPCWCPTTRKRRPCWCPTPILWELNSFPMQTLSIVPKHLHKCWPRE